MKISSQENERRAIILYEHSRGSGIISRDVYFRYSRRVQSSEDGPSDLIKIVVDKTRLLTNFLRLPNCRICRTRIDKVARLASMLG